MPKSLSRLQIEEAIEVLVNFQQFLDQKFPDHSQPYIKSYKEFLMKSKVEEVVDRLVDDEIEYKISELVTEKGNLNFLQKSELLLEWEQYKKIPKTNLTYRYDTGQNRPGMEDHIHVYLGNSKNQVYAINKSGTPHDGSKAQLSKKEIKFLKDLGFTPPENGLLEWITLDPTKQYIGYKRQLLLD